MHVKHDSKNLNTVDDVIDIQELFDVFLQEKKTVISVTAFVSIVGVIVSLFIPNIYESKALLAPANTSAGISGGLDTYSNLAGLANINLSSGDSKDNSEEALHKTVSLSFFKNNILTNIYLPDLMAVKSWDPEKNLVLYDKKVYDIKNNIWIRDFSYPQKQIPSAQESYEVFLKKHLSISKDKLTGFSTLSIKHKSPFIAKQWTDLIFNEVNSFYRQKDRLKAEKSVGYLNEQISMTGLSEIKQVLAQLLQEEIKKLTLIEANQAYVFDYIDPPAVMEKKSSPNRAIICILSFIFGVVLSIALVFTRRYRSNKEVLSK